MSERQGLMHATSEDIIMTPKCSLALVLPEILNITFAFLDRASLVACAQVNSLWADEATNMLWANPPLFALSTLLPSGRAQLYADKVSRLRSLPFKTSTRSSYSKFHRAYGHLSFPRLSELSLTIEDIQWLPQYLQPSLRKLMLKRFSDKPNLDDCGINKIYMQLSTRCPHLRQLIIEEGVSLTAEELLRFLEAMPSIRTLMLMSDALVAENIMQHLAARPNLEGLSVPKAISESLAAKMDRASESPFADLRILCCRVKEDALISKHMTKLVILDIAMHDPSSTIQSAVSGCPALKRLKVCVFNTESKIVGTDLLSLAERCPRLECVSLLGIRYKNHSKRLVWSYKGGIDGSSIHDNDIYHFSGLLPGLKELSLDARGALSIRSLQHLGRNCKNLRMCCLSGCIFDILELHDGDISNSPAGDVAALRALETSRATHSVPSHTDSQTDTMQTKSVLANNMNFNLKKPLEHAEISHDSAFQESRSLFPNLLELEIAELSNPRSITIPELLSLLQRAAPKLESFRVQSKAESGCEVALAFRRIQQGLSDYNPSKNAYDRDLDQQDGPAVWA